jgi:hypothetical protein
VTQSPAYFPLGGGLDLVTPHIARKPGRPIAALNYEPVAAGYRRIRGYEKTKGGLATSDTTYAKLSFTAGTAALGALVQGNPFRIDTPGHAAIISNSVVVAPPVLLSGSYGAGTAAGYILVVPVIRDSAAVPVTSPQALDVVTTPASVTMGVVSAHWTINDATVGTQVQRDAWNAYARTWRRGAVGAPLGSGPVRGVAFFDGGLLAIRDNGANARFSKAPTNTVLEGGWVDVPINSVVAYTNGNDGVLNAIPTGTPFVGATSGATGVARKFYVTSGSWSAGTAAGFMAYTPTAGAFTAAETVNFTGGASLTATAAGTTPTMLAGGKFEMIVHNFYGASDLRRVYGVSGVDQAFEYDGTIFVKIATGMANDKPNHIAEHGGALFLSFPGGSIQFSQVGEPTVFNPIVGAGEFGIGADCTNFISLPEALGITSDKSVSVLYGSDASDYTLKTLNDQSGALAGTAQRVLNGIFLDNGGLRSIAATQQFGNFRMGSLSQLVAPLLEDLRKDGVNPVCSMTLRASDQYWLFFDNNTGIIVYLGAKEPSILPFALDITVTCCASEVVDGVERAFIGASDGYVYELGKGNSFDGGLIEHYLRLSFNHFGSPRQKKTAHSIVVEMSAPANLTLSVSVDVNNGAEQGVPEQLLYVETGGGALDDLGSNEQYYASQIASTGTASIATTAKNFAAKFAGDTADQDAHTLTGVTYLISPKGLER